jgi:phospholipase D-like protein
MEKLIPLIFLAFFGIIVVLGTIFWIWMIIDVVQVPDDSMFKAGNKLVWILIIVFTQFIGAAIYWFVGRPARA